MTVFRPDTSFPYLKIAREYGVEYWRVLQFADLVDQMPPTERDWARSNMWEIAVCLAWVKESGRRAMVRAS